MSRIVRYLLAAIVLALCFTATAASAQQQQSVRLVGTIEAVDGSALSVKTRQGSEAKVTVTDNVTVFGITKATLADLKPGAFVGVGATPQPDGSQRAVQVVVFAESQRGTGEGFRPWDRIPNGTMTNATIDTTVGSVDGQTLTVKYSDGEKKIIVPPDATMLAYVVGAKSELKAGANIAIVNAVKKPDGTFEAARVNVGRDGVVPQ